MGETLKSLFWTHADFTSLPDGRHPSFEGHADFGSALNYQAIFLSSADPVCRTFQNAVITADQLFTNGFWHTSRQCILLPLLPT